MSTIITMSGNGKTNVVPFINRSFEIREGMTFHYGSNKENSPLTDMLGYWWGIMINGEWVWRNFVKLPNTPENNIDDEGLKQQAIADTVGWLSGVAQKLLKESKKSSSHDKHQ